MRKREMSYQDYGIDKDEEKRLKKYCRSPDFMEHDTLLQASISSNPAIASDIYYSLVKGVSFERINNIEYIPIPKVDFYGYQRNCLAIFRNLLIMCGKWK